MIESCLKQNCTYIATLIFRTETDNAKLIEIGVARLKNQREDLFGYDVLDYMVMSGVFCDIVGISRIASTFFTMISSS